MLDTSAWIEFLIGTPAGKTIWAALPAREGWMVPTIVQLELAKWLTREAGEDRADQVTAFTQMCRIVPLSTKIALSAAAICVIEKLSTADAIIYATALEYEAGLITCEAHFSGLPGVTYISKTGH